MAAPIMIPYTRDDYTVGWVCALPKERTAAIYMLKERHPDLKQPRGDSNAYILGKMGEHNVVIAGLPKGRTGTTSSATVAAQMISSFPNIRVGLLVGIGSGIPQKVQLGDVVIGVPVDDRPAVIQWDIGRAEDKGFVQTGSLNPPAKLLLSALAKFEAEQIRAYTTTMEYLRQVPMEYFQSPQPKDIAYDSSYQHIGGSNCNQCDDNMAMKRELKSEKPHRVHYGLVASGSQVIKSGEQRDKLYHQFNDIMCIETEAAGIMNDFPCIIIRGISDYADSHINVIWQDYAAAAAAAYAKTFLDFLSMREVDKLEAMKSLIPPGEVERTVNSWLSYWFSKSPTTPPPQYDEQFDRDSIAKLPPAERNFHENDKIEGEFKEISNTMNYTSQSLNGRKNSEFRAFQKTEDDGPSKFRVTQSIFTGLEEGTAVSNDDNERTPRWHANEKGPESVTKSLSAPHLIAPQNDGSSLINQGIQLPTDSGYSSTALKAEPAHNVQEGDLTDANDDRTIYSDTSNLSESRKESYISQMADDLFSKTLSEEVDEEVIERIFEILPKLLKSFALKFGHNALQMHRDVMFFAHRYRREIAENFKDRYFAEVESLADVRDSDPDKMSLGEIMGRWESSFAGATDHDTYETSIVDSIDRESNEERIEDEDQTNLPYIQAYNDLFLKSPAYEWLLANLRKELILAPAEPDAMDSIRSQIVESLPSLNRVSRKRPPETYKMTFVLEWDPLEFVDEQGYQEEPQKAIGTAITLTGSATDAQALACSQYLRQTWPSTGEHVIQLIEDVIRSGASVHDPSSCDLPDKTKLNAWTQNSNFIVEAFGIADSIAEIGEQLAWLSAALSPPASEFGVTYCTPFISDIQVNKSFDPLVKGYSSPDILCKMNYTVQQRGEPFVSPNGQCWHNLFKNPTVVTGYPIPRRSKSDIGLELPLNMMAGLARTNWVNSFNGNLFIKGFSTMLVPTERNGDMIIWHLVYNHDRKRISYLENTVQHAKNVSIFDLETTRHILGWCSEAAFFAGAADANYENVKPSRLSLAHEGCALQGVFLCRGHLITGGIPFGIGHKDTPIHISRNGYIEKLKWIHGKFVLLWDEEDKRGWLLNGTSALLHLIRSSLENDRTGEFNSEFLFHPEDFQEAPMTHQANSAAKVLQNRKNLNLKVYQEKEDYIRLENRIEEFFDTLEKIIDYQADVRRGLHAKSKARKHLEGWDYNDLAKQRDSIRPRVATIQPAGKGWIDFTRAIDAITLFGRGFGEVIRPAENILCSHWATLPKGEYYLAASGYDLKKIMEIDGNIEGNPMDLCGNIIWHSPDRAFEPCQCSETSHTEHSDLVQVLLPSKFRRKILPANNPVYLKDCSAVIFGHSLTSKWYWEDIGDPKQGGLPSQSKDSDFNFYDSGVGSSLLSSTSQSSRDSAGSAYQQLSSVSNDASIDNLNPEDYTVGIVCALPKELMAVRILFDRNNECPVVPLGDHNHYVAGRIGRHNVVAACLPFGEYGTNSAATVVSNMRRSYTSIEFCLLIGIGGGVPSKQNDIRLGDVVVSRPTGEHPGVIQYDLGKDLQGSGFRKTGSLQRPPDFLMTAISILESNPSYSPETMLQSLAYVSKCKPEYKYPGVEHDKLFKAEHEHDPTHDTCSELCGSRITRSSDNRNHPNIHYGLIASGNKVMRDAHLRDTIGQKYNVLCFEMEAAGVMNHTPCLVIRGICDYADSHKNDIWQEYAAATAASYAKLLLSVARNMKNSG